MLQTRTPVPAVNEEQQTAYAEYVAAFKVARAALGKGQFPPAVQADVDELIASYRSLEDVYAQLAEDPALDVGETIQEGADHVRAIATRIRAALGLPPPPEG